MQNWVKAGDVAVDIGGNIGLYTSWLSRCVGAQGQVHTFEPVPVLQDAVRRTVARNHLTNVRVSDCALGAREETISIVLDPFNSGNNWLSHKAAPGQSIPVRVVPLDDFEFERPPSFIKIDVQGWEVEVFRGMTRILGSPAAPVLFCEVSEPALKAAGSSADVLGQILLDHGYTLQVAALRGGQVELRPISLAELVAKAAHVLYFDILALPPGRSAP
jgi:FkbM family methyltransferase